MSVLKTKSDENYRSSQILLNQSFFSSSVHCSYYSCVQIMKHILLQIDNKTENDIYEEQRANDNNLHEYLINYFVNKLRDNNLYSTYRNSIGRLTELKLLRNKADYKEIVISESEAIRANTLSSQILSDLKYLNGIR